MATALDLINMALMKIGVLAPGEVLTDADAELGLSTLNTMLDSWSNASLDCYAIQEQSVVLNPTQGQYTIGPGGDIDTNRPIKLKSGPGSAFSVDQDGNRYMMEVVPRDRWNSIYNVTEVINANYPEILFYDPQYPLGILNFWPVPNMSGYTAYFDSYLPLSDLGSLTAPLSLPPGYQKAIQDNLALELFPFYLPGEPSGTLRQQAYESRRLVKVTNIRPFEAAFDFGRQATPYTLQDFQQGR